MTSSTPPAPPSAMVIFGARGDLTKRLLMPALYNLSAEKLLDEKFCVIGVDHSAGEDDGFRSELTEDIQLLAKEKGGEFSIDHIDDAAWGWLRGRLSYLQGDFEDSEAYKKLADKIGNLDGHGNCIFYLAVAPHFFGIIVDHLAAAGLLRESKNCFRRVVIEKPFGDDLNSAKALNARILAEADESQIYRIDHFLGKETVQNIMALRFANGIFEPIWNRDHIDHVQITAAETVGVEGRAKFYETAGALRDMVPNHMMQLLAMTAIEPPSNFGAEAVRAEKSKVASAIHHMSPEEMLRDTVRAQYQAGTLGDKAVVGYRDEPGVDAKSQTETYVALKLSLDNWRWAGVPFYLRTGKRLGTRRTEIVIKFKHAPFSMFRDTPVEALAANDMVLQISPEEGMTLNFSAKIPGPEMQLAPVGMKFRYSDYFGTRSSTGYETLIYDVLIGDATLFQRADTIEGGWAAVQPALDGWAKGEGVLETYAAGSTGPQAADALMERDGRHWRKLL